MPPRSAAIPLDSQRPPNTQGNGAPIRFGVGRTIGVNLILEYGLPQQVGGCQEQGKIGTEGVAATEVQLAVRLSGCRLSGLPRIRKGRQVLVTPVVGQAQLPRPLLVVATLIAGVADTRDRKFAGGAQQNGIDGGTAADMGVIHGSA